ncbi:hypothetical protein LWC33_20300 [Pseudonocardia sp. RS11V-5]|uniref:hypothetical protein n=1 Tax=Pseudonocardia terrae TaxID=2905831 RepID=UPI001E3F9C37|nr:hypothetical protein [Pseudonocardia terrae]MCE3553784.1 hypothetical protein [Pseudonocardia terrae]
MSWSFDPGSPWWLGIANVEQRFGRSVDLATLRTVPVQTVVGDRDLATTEIAEPGVDTGGATRLEAGGATRRGAG